MSCQLCGRCAKEPATVHIAELCEPGRWVERHLCKECAAAHKERLFETVSSKAGIVRTQAPEGAPCERCGKKPAAVHDTQVVDGRVVKEETLCKDCAARASEAFMHRRPSQAPAEAVRRSSTAPEVLAEQVRRALLEAGDVKRCFAERAATDIAKAVETVLDCLRSGGKVLLCGNGGSAAEAQHIAAELVGRFKLERPALPAIALTTNTSILTAIANDYSFDDIFARQVGALGAPGDVLFAYSTSGTSKNVLRAIQAAKIVGMSTVGFTGVAGGAMANTCDICIKVPSDDTPLVQECHTTAGHTICLLVEQMLCGRDEPPDDAGEPVLV
jgi:D-sedoheptulose 7-phosphate isomerase